MKSMHKEAITAKEMNILSSSKLTWMLLGVWLIYSAVMLWHFKEQADLNASVCKVTR